ncbi:MAG: hypothetical protein J7L43_01120, partial [Candidatus Aenigmarchaeota archaeon]|nr:hypothetical protein [Candidatus Aenigmarchaeota archaeon]
IINNEIENLKHSIKEELYSAYLKGDKKKIEELEDSAEKLGISSNEIKEKAKKEMSTTIRYIYSDDSKKLLGNLASALKEKIEEAKNKAKKLSSFLGNKTINQIIEDERNKMKLESNGENKSENEENKFRGGEMTKGRIREKFRTGISRIKEGMEKGKRKVGGKLLQIKVGRIGKKVGTITKDVKFLEDEDKGGRSKDKKIENIHEMIKEIKSESDGGQKGEAGEEEIKEKDQEIERRKREIIDKLEEEYKKGEGYNPRGIHELKKELYSLIGKEEAEKIRKDLVDKYWWSKQKTEESEVAESPKEEENYGGQPTQPENIGNQPPRPQPIPGTQNFKIPKSGGLVSSVVKTNLKHMSISGGIGGIIGLIAYFVLHIPLIYSVIIVFVFMLLGIDLFRGGIFEAVFTPVIIGVVLTVALHWFINQFIPSIWEFTGLLFIAVLSISIIVILDVSQMK